MHPQHTSRVFCLSGILLLISALALGVAHAVTLTAAQAKDHVGKNATVRGIKV